MVRRDSALMAALSLLRAGAGLVAGVLTGRGSRAELARAGAPHILDSVTGLLPLLGVPAA